MTEPGLQIFSFIKLKNTGEMIKIISPVFYTSFVSLVILTLPSANSLVATETVFS